MSSGNGRSPRPAPTRDERVAAAAAMASWWLCPIIGQVLVLSWARRHESQFANRYASTSLALVGVILLLGVPLVLMYFVGTALTFVAVFLAVWLAQLAVGVLAIVLATKAWRGYDVSDGPLPNWLTQQLPGAAQRSE